MREDGRINREGDASEVDEANDEQMIIDYICNGDASSEDANRSQDLSFC